MPATADRTHRPWLHWIHPVHAVLLAGTIPLFLGAVLSDTAYAASYEVQWINFSAWLNAGGLVFCGLAALWAVVDWFRADRRGWRTLAFALLLLTTWIVGFINALIHARDAWASMPTGLVLSIVVAALACIATAAGFSRPRAGGAE